MIGPGSLIDRIDDLLNPIIVRELRQVVRGKFIWSVLILFLVFQCAILSISIAGRGMTSRSVGMDTLSFLFSILFFASFLLIPLFNGFKFAREQSEGSDELLFITTITPEAIIRGKFAASMIFILMLYSAFSPFMAMTFFLSGVDLPMTFMTLFIAFILSAVGSMAQICFATLARDGHSQQFFRGIAVFVQITTFFSISGSGSDMLRYGASSYFGSSDPLPVVISIVLGSLALTYFLYLASAAVISPAGSNRMYPVRRGATVIWLLSLILAVFWAERHGTGSFLFTWLVAVSSLLVIAVLVAVSERDFLTERVAREIPHKRPFRDLAFLMYSGAAGGIAWVIVMMLLTVCVIAFFPFNTGISSLRGLSEAMPAFMIFTVYCLAYAMIGSVIRRKLLYNYIEIRNTWVVALLVCTAFSILPVFLGAFTGFDAESLMIGNPFMMAANKLEGGFFAALFFLLAIILNFRWLSRQYKAFMTAGNSDDQQL